MGHIKLATKYAGITSKCKNPVVTSCAPPTDVAAGGAAIVITGKNFSRSSTPAVTFGGVAATGVSVISSTTIHCTAPAHGAGVVDVVVTNSNKGDGHSLAGTGTGAFTYT